MKKFYFTLATFLFLAVTNAQIVNIPDANFKAKLLSASPSNLIASTQTPFYNFAAGHYWSVNSYDKIDTNNDGEIQVSEAQLIKYLYIPNSNIVNLEGIESFTNLQYLNCYNNQLTSLNVYGLTNLQGLNCGLNQLPSLNVQGLTNLRNLECVSNQLTSLNVQGLTNLIDLTCDNNQLTSLNVQGLINFYELSCNDNQLTSLYIKNGNYFYDLRFNNNPNLAYICANEAHLTSVQNKVNLYGYTTTCNINSYCSFTPGGVFYTIQGNQKIDANNNGCDVNDSVYPNLKFDITDGTLSGSLISNSTGNYSIPVQAGTHTITPQIENPTYFNVSPTNATVTFPATTTPFTQNFCIVPNGVHHDLEVVVIPIYVARPGFDAKI